MTDIPQVVFACVRNGGRSVASRVLTEHYAGGRVTALSAGTQPGEHIHREVADILEKLGLDTSHEQPKLLTRDTIAASTMAITLGCGEECPYVPGVRYVDWPVADPGGQDEATVREIIADLDGRVRALLLELSPDIDLPPSVLGHHLPLAPGSVAKPSGLRDLPAGLRRQSRTVGQVDGPASAYASAETIAAAPSYRPWPGLRSM
jgi:arsenate reductase (thioredoxin)